MHLSASILPFFLLLASLFATSNTLKASQCKRSHKFAQLHGQTLPSTTKHGIQDCADDEMRLEFYKLVLLMNRISRGGLAGFRLKFVGQPTQTEGCVMALGNGFSVIIEPKKLSPTQLTSLQTMPLEGLDRICKVIDFESNEVLYYHFDTCPVIVDDYSFLSDIINALHIPNDAIVHVDIMRIE